jgi:NAD(P)-dependent dehydrogenase (short-subunit alcohol dehydrogenase family)
VDHFEGKVAVVTGGSGGIGRAIVAELFRRGCAVASLDRTPDRGRDALSLICDVTDPASIEAAMSQVNAELGTVELLVCAAGVLGQSPVVDLPLDEWRRVLEASLTGTFLVCRAVVPDMVRAGRGRIVALSSGFGTKGYGGGAHYAAAKAGVDGFVKSLALEVATCGVRVNAVAPGPVETAMLAGILDDQARAQRVSAIPMGRLGRPEDVVGPVMFLLGPDSDYVTGQVLHVNGGMLMP